MAIAAAAAMALAGVAAGALTRSPPAAPPAVAPAAVCCRLPGNLRDGDLVFRRGRDLVSHVVLSEETAGPGARTGRYSHVGVVLAIDGRANVVHAIPAEGRSPGGVVVEPLETFAAASQAESLAFERPPLATEPARQRVRQYLLAQVGKPFDARFRFASDDSFYCTALALKALRAGGADLTPAVPPLHFALLDEAVYAPDGLHGVAALTQLTP